MAIEKNLSAIEIVGVDHPVLSPFDVAAVLLEGRIVGIGIAPQEVPAIEAFREVNDMLTALDTLQQLGQGLHR